MATQREATRASKADRETGRAFKVWGTNPTGPQQGKIRWGWEGDKHKLRFLLPASEVHVEKATTTTTTTCSAANSSRKILVQCNNTQKRKRNQKIKYKINKKQVSKQLSTMFDYYIPYIR